MPAVPATTGSRSSLTAVMPPGGLGAILRRHWLFAVLLTLGLVLRVLTQVAYRPALLYIDSVKYLFGAYPGNDPPGYQLMLRAFLGAGSLSAVAAVQHLCGLAMAVALYLVLRRRGVPPWLAALGTAPLLLDAYQLQIEQSIMPDTAFEVFIVAGLVLLLWRPRPAWWMVLAGGAALGASATVRQVGEILIVPAVVYLLIVVPGLAGEADPGGRAVRPVRRADPAGQLPELRDDQALRAGALRGGHHVRPGRRRRGLRDLEAARLRAAALPVAAAAEAGPGLAGPRRGVTGEDADPPPGHAPRRRGHQLRRPGAAPAAAPGGGRSGPGRRQAVRRGPGHRRRRRLHRPVAVPARLPALPAVHRARRRSPAVRRSSPRPASRG